MNSSPHRSRSKDPAKLSLEPTARGSRRDECFCDCLEALVLRFLGVVAGGHSAERLRVSSALSREFAGQPCVGDYQIPRPAVEPAVSYGCAEATGEASKAGPSVQPRPPQFELKRWLRR